MKSKKDIIDKILWTKEILKECKEDALRFGKDLTYPGIESYLSALEWVLETPKKRKVKK